MDYKASDQVLESLREIFEDQVRASPDLTETIKPDAMFMLLNVIVSLAVRQFICALLSEMLTMTNLGMLNVIRNDIMEEAHTVSQRYSNPSEYKNASGRLG